MNLTYHIHVKKNDETHVIWHSAGLESEKLY